MKKLTKKSLDELAEVMPVISEKNQQECVGGYYFVGGTGDYLNVNTINGDEIRVISQENYSSFYAAVNSGHLSTYEGGQELNELFSDEKLDVYRGMCTGSVSGFNGIQYYESDFYWDSSKPAIFMNEYNQVIFNAARSLNTASQVNTAWDAFLSGIEVD